ncbi:hypothetical protein BDQ12DRAFT_172722 [Crucibulum laeve]|uniref:Uncharacterized protein n=1 Tax=Crucibulum laeve TaxID=68775 RepID=A0A5C3MF94_9AGAR|nr:hypothetical protein BDQ12DRAFT_172722 [Crucibulum laeve]
MTSLMSFTNINDPAGVQALLDQLRASQAWQEIANTASTAPPTTLSNQSPEEDSTASYAPNATEATPIGDASSSSGRTSVAALLSQLQGSSVWSTLPPAPEHAYQEPAPTSVTQSDHGHHEVALPSHDVQMVEIPQDVRHCTFQQALPYLGKLADDQSFVAAIIKMKKDQDDLEKSLWRDRCAIQTKYEEKVKVAKTKASMIGTGLSKHEADMINATFKKEMGQFDRDRALPAWDGLVSKQQAALDRLGVPTMFVTQESAARERQQRVMKVLDGVADV